MIMKLMNFNKALVNNFKMLVTMKIFGMQEEKMTKLNKIQMRAL